MKLLTVPAFAGICFAAAINPFDPLVCFDPSPSRISATSTTFATQSVTSTAKGWVTTSGGLVTSYDYNNASSTVWVFPTGSGSHEATKVIFEGVQVINVSFVVVVVEVIDSQTMTVVSSDSSSTSNGSTTATSASVSTTSPDSTAITQPGATHLVDVGTGQGFAYNPSQLNASIGDTVRFNFLGRNHSVTQSDLTSPCTYNGGFDTGLNQFNPLNITGKFLVDYQVNVSTPLWFYW
jgi:plastocyanin